MIGRTISHYEILEKLGEGGMGVSKVKRRKGLRLKDYDYSEAGAYFVTICTHDREELLGEIAEGEMRLNQLGQFVKACWEDLPRHYKNVQLDEFVVMPNYMHSIFVIHDDSVGAIPRRGPSDMNRPYQGL